MKNTKTLTRVAPVSSTHLDVYKRQGMMCKWSDPFSKHVLIGRGLDHNSLETLRVNEKM